MNQIARFCVDNVFEITGRGLILAGKIVDGIVSKGNQVELTLNDKTRKWLILDIDRITHSNSEKVNIGLVINCQNNDDFEELKNSTEILTMINIYSEKLKTSDLLGWLSVISEKDNILFNELLLSNLTVINRAIWSNDETDDRTKLEALKWSNELSHRIWNIISDLRKNDENESEKRLCNNIDYCASQSKELARHLGALLKTTLNRFYYIIENR